MAANSIESTSSLTFEVMAVDISQLNFFTMPDDGGSWYCSPVEQELITAQSEVVNHLTSHYGVKVKTTSLRKFRYSLNMWLTGLDENDNGPSFCAHMANLNGSVNPFLEFAKWLVGRSDHVIPCIGLGAIEKIMTFAKSKQVSEKIEGITQRLKTELEDLLGSNGILLYPSHPTVAPPHHKPIYTPFNFAYTAVFNVLGFAVTQVPLGLNSKGLPLGVKIVSTSGNDHLKIGVAIELEKTMLSKNSLGLLKKGAAKQSRIKSIV